MYINETIHNHSTNNTKHSKCKCTQYQNTHTLQNKLKQPRYKIHTKWNCHNTIKYPQYKVTLMYMVLLSPRTSPSLTSLQNKSTSHKSRPFTPHHYTSHHLTYLHLIRTLIPLLVTTRTFLTPFLIVFSVQGKDTSEPAGKFSSF